MLQFCVSELALVHFMCIYRRHYKCYRLPGKPRLQSDCYTLRGTLNSAHFGVHCTDVTQWCWTVLSQSYNLRSLHLFIALSQVVSVTEHLYHARALVWTTATVFFAILYFIVFMKASWAVSRRLVSFERTQRRWSNYTAISSLTAPVASAHLSKSVVFYFICHHAHLSQPNVAITDAWSS